MALEFGDGVDDLALIRVRLHKARAYAERFVNVVAGLSVHKDSIVGDQDRLDALALLLEDDGKTLQDINDELVILEGFASDLETHYGFSS